MDQYFRACIRDMTVESRLLHKQHLSLLTLFPLYERLNQMQRNQNDLSAVVLISCQLHYNDSTNVPQYTFYT